MEREILIPRYMASFKEFCRNCMGSKDMNKEHDDLCSFIQFDPHDFLLILTPRYSIKTQICTEDFSIWDLVRNPNHRILIYSDNATKAEVFLTRIKNHYEGKAARSKFRDIFGDWTTDPHTGKWNDSQIIIKKRTEAQDAPSIDTSGIESSKVGMHFDIIIFDDIVSDLNTTTKAQMDKVYDCYKKALALLKPGGKIIMVGTRWHFGDAYGRIISENEKTNRWGIFIRDAETVSPDGKMIYESIGLSRTHLDNLRAEMGSYMYSCLMRNSPVDSETAIFKYEDFKFYGELTKEDIQELYITCTLDPAGEGEDFTAFTVVGTDKNMNMYLLDLVNKHLQPSEIVDNVIRLAYKWRFNKLGVETNFFRGMLEREIKMQVDLERHNSSFKLFSIEEFKATSRRGESKEIRIRGLQPYHERGSLLFPGDKFERLTGAFNELAYQMLQFPKAPHDDVLDALAYQLNIMHKGGTVKTNKPAFTSAAWFEMQQYEEMQKMNKVVPSRLKRNFKFSFN